MADAIVYCDACGRLVRPSEIEEGKAVKRGDETLCPDCLAKLPPEKRRELRGGRKTPSPSRRATPRPAGRKPTPRPTSSRRAHSDGRGSRPGGVLIASCVVGLLAGLVVVVAMVGGDDDAPAASPSRPATATPAPVVRPAVPAPAPVATPAGDAAPASTEPSSDDDEYFRRLREQSEARRARVTESAAPADARVRQAAKTWDAAWTLVRTRDDQGLSSQSPLSHMGRDNVMVTHPFPDGVPAALTREVSIPAGSTATLTVTATTGNRIAEEDWVLAVLVDGESIGERVVGRIDGAARWQTFTFDLSRFAGRAITMRLENRAGGRTPWAWEHAFWGEARVDVR